MILIKKGYNQKNQKPYNFPESSNQMQKFKKYKQNRKKGGIRPMSNNIRTQKMTRVSSPGHSAMSNFDINRRKKLGLKSNKGVGSALSTF